MSHRFVFRVALMVAAMAAAVAWLTAADPSTPWEPRLFAMVGGALIGLAGSVWVLGIEEQHRDQVFDKLQSKNVRAKRARVEAEFPEDLADKIASGELSKQEARKRHRADQRGPDDGWVVA